MKEDNMIKVDGRTAIFYYKECKDIPQYIDSLESVYYNTCDFYIEKEE